MGKTGRHDRRTFLKILRSRYSLILLLSGLLAYGFGLPDPLFDKPLSFILEDKNGQLLGAKIAEDGQWRFPPSDSLPQAYLTSLIAFEDKRFYKHPGIDPISLFRAIYQNIKAGRVVSGGSTLHMQVMRMALEHHRRNIPNKLLEMIWATRLELKYSKKEILALYAANAPFGGNVIGLEAASWRYFNKKPDLLSWAESAMLAVLPNSPGLIHPGRNRQQLLKKRDSLLKKLWQQGKIDATTYELSISEPLPEIVHALPRLAPHLLEEAFNAHYPDKHRVRSSVDRELQVSVNTAVRRHHNLLKLNQVHNIAALVVDISTRQPVVYIGNVWEDNTGHQEQVDVIQAARSSGSILKPLLAALMMHEGQIIPPSLIPDVPVNINGYQPENFNSQYDGLVSVEKALARSLNIPFVNLLQRYGIEKFHHGLKQAGISTLAFPPSHYGLTMVLGGAEVSLQDVCFAYVGMARTLRYFAERNSQYAKADFSAPSLLVEEASGKAEKLQEQPAFVGAAAAWLAFKAMQQVERPNELGQWERFFSAQDIAWKTGTSFGFKDAWAVGLNGNYVVGVWAGNADGEGRPGLTGIRAAAPLLFEIFDLLPRGFHFQPPWDDLISLDICRESGYRAGKLCPVENLSLPQHATRLALCPHHKLSADESFQLNRSCASIEEMHAKTVFSMPPLESHYYQTKNPHYRPVPPFRPDCVGAEQVMELIYPKVAAKIYVPLDFDGAPSRTVFEVAHQQAEKTIYWHLDQQYLGSTRKFHNMALNPSPGQHYLTLVDEDGNRLVAPFEIISGK